MIDSLGSDLIRTVLPHRYPFLLVDKVVELEPGRRAVGIKNVTVNEPFFQGHFPGVSVMPGVLLIESMAQVAGIMILSCQQYRGKIPFIASVDAIRFYHPVVPGDTLRIEATVAWVRSMVGKVAFVTRVGDKVVAKGEIKFALKEPPPSADEQMASLGVFTDCTHARKQGE
ncbi:MAG TPA: 3-hydroxyacyl-ACP dehydratase FabZ [Chthonomonadaceae bacterium]|nr:3-hydroxyacyl-ACP dehydratase FabZ [Chthonomonadaceae bacterium]